MPKYEQRTIPSTLDKFPVHCPKCHNGVRVEGTLTLDHGRHYLRYTCDHGFWDDWATQFKQIPQAAQNDGTERCIITYDHLRIRITNYHGRDFFATHVTPTRAFQLARDLIAAALECDSRAQR